MSAQLASLEHGAHIIVGTPGRIEDHIKRATLSLKHVQTLVLDEADRMLDMGFQVAVDAIVQRTPKTRQTLLFSATFPDKIKAMSRRIMRKPAVVKVESHTIAAQSFNIFISWLMLIRVCRGCVCCC